MSEIQGGRARESLCKDSQKQAESIARAFQIGRAALAMNSQKLSAAGRRIAYHQSMEHEKKHGCLWRCTRCAIGCMVLACALIAATNGYVLATTHERIITQEAAGAGSGHSPSHAPEASAEDTSTETMGATFGGTYEKTAAARALQALDGPADAIVVLGASVLPDGTPSAMLADRLDCAAELYCAGAAPRIIVTGDNSTASYNECAAMKAHLIRNGIPSASVYCDHWGVATYDSMYRASHVFEVKRAVVVTQAYHLPRALCSARLLGIDAVGIAAGGGPYARQWYYDLREIPARTKDLVKALAAVPADEPGGSVDLNASGDLTD